MNNWFIRVLQRDIVTDPEQWRNAGPGKFIKLSDRAKNVYCVLCVIAYSQAGNAEGMVVQGGMRLGSDWFYAYHSMLRQLTGSCDKTVQRGIKELKEEGLIGYYPAKNQSQKCCFKIKRIKYNNKQESVRDVQFKSKTKSGEKKNQKSPPRDATYQKEGVLYRRGKDTHNEEGKPIDTEGNCVDPAILSGYKKLLNEGKNGARFFLHSIQIKKLENHLSPEYREKFEKYKIEMDKKMMEDEEPF